MIGFLGPEDITIVVLIAAVLFGAKKIPELARSLGRAKGEFHKGMTESAAPTPEGGASDMKES
jgi:sec-independent protein translocase protein TatA